MSVDHIKGSAAAGELFFRLIATSICIVSWVTHIYSFISNTFLCCRSSYFHVMKVCFILEEGLECIVKASKLLKRLEEVKPIIAKNLLEVLLFAMLLGLSGRHAVCLLRCQPYQECICKPLVA